MQGVNTFLLVLAAIIPVVNPPGTALVFLGLTHGASAEVRGGSHVGGDLTQKAIRVLGRRGACSCCARCHFRRSRGADHRHGASAQTSSRAAPRSASATYGSSWCARDPACCPARGYLTFLAACGAADAAQLEPTSFRSAALLCSRCAGTWRFGACGGRLWLGAEPSLACHCQAMLPRGEL
jgi:hypothetical protein